MKKTAFVRILLISIFLFADCLSTVQPVRASMPTQAIDALAQTPYPPPSPDSLSPAAEHARAQQAMEIALAKHLTLLSALATDMALDVQMEGDWAYATAVSPQIGQARAEAIAILAHRLPNGTWQALTPSDYEGYGQLLDRVPETLVARKQKDAIRAQVMQYTVPQSITPATLQPTSVPVLSTSASIESKTSNAIVMNPADENAARIFLPIITSETEIEIEDAISNGQFVYGPNIGSFNIGNFFRSTSPHLLSYGEELYGRAEYYSINPKVYLTLIEMSSHLISSKEITETASENPFGLTESGFLQQIDKISALLFDAYYLHLYKFSPLPIKGRNIPALILKDGTLFDVPPTLSAGTYAIINALTALRDKEGINLALDRSNPNSFYQTYLALFPDDNPLSDANHIFISGEVGSSAAPANLLQLPYPRSESWKFNGVHGANGGSDMSSIDFSPGWPGWNSDTSNMWVVAAATGVPTKISACNFKISHTDGWETVYYHLENIQNFGGTIQQNSRIGIIANTLSEATCNGGDSTGPHVHFTLKQNGALVAINGTALSGWYIHSGRYSYDTDRNYMWLERSGVKKYYGDWLNNDSNNGSDTTRPDGDITSPNAGATITSRTVRLDGWGSDSQSGFARAHFTANYGGSWRQVGPDFTTATFGFDWDLCDAGVPNGSVELGLDLWDNAGNQANSPHGTRRFTKNFSDCNPSPPQCNPNADQVALYVDGNHSGQCVVKGLGEYANPDAIGLPNDSASSIKVGSNVKAILCRDDNYGSCEDFTSDDGNLSDNSIGNDQVSSLKVQQRAASPDANFDAWPQSGAAPLVVAMHIVSTANLSSCAWDYGDGTTGISCNGYHDHTYTNAGVYTVRLTVNGPGGSDTETRTDYIRVSSSVPAAPTLQSPSNGATFTEGAAINLTWSATGAQYYGEITGGPSPLTFDWQNESAKNLGPQWAGYTYSWRVKAKNSAGESAWSSTRTFTVKPATPTNLSAQVASRTQINLSWADNSGNEAGYKLYRDGTFLAQVGADVTTYQDANASCNTTYTYQAKAYRGSIESDGSNSVSATTSACQQAPTQPVLRNPPDNALLSTTDDITLEWNAVSNATEYAAELWGPDGDRRSGRQSGTTWHIGQLPTGTYDWKVEAYNDAGWSGWALRRFVVGCSGDNFEPNNNSAQAKTIAYGQTRQAKICPTADEDFYSFTGQSGDKVVAEVDAQVNGSTLDPYLVLLDSDGTTVLAFNDDEREGVYDSHLSYTLAHSGSYYLKVREFNHPDEGGDNYSYSLKLSTDSVDPHLAQITAPRNDEWLNPTQTTITASASDRESGISRVEFLWHDSNWQNPDWVWLGADYDGSNGWSWNFNTSGLSEQQGGAFFIWAFDWADNYASSAVWNLGIDRTPATSAVQSLPATSGASFTVNWSGTDTMSGIANYDIQSRDGATANWIDWLSDTTNTSAAFSGQTGHTYYFRSRASDRTGNVEGWPTGASGDAYTEVRVSLTAPSNLAATAAGQTQINLSWSDNSNNETGFKIERSPDGTTGWAQITTVGDNATTYLHNGLTCGTLYYYRVRAYNTTSDSSYSNASSAQTTACASDLIFADDFESNNLSKWSSCNTDAGDLSVTTAAKLSGTYGLQTVLDDNNVIYCTDETPNAEPRYRVRFYFDPNTIAMKNNDAHYIFYGYSGTATIVLRVELRFASKKYQLRVGLVNDGTTWKNSGWIKVTDAPHVVEVDWKASDTAKSKNGYLMFWVDSAQKANLTKIDNDTRRIDRIQLGAVALVDTNTRGTYYFDDFVSRQQAYIGPVAGVQGAFSLATEPITEMVSEEVSIPATVLSTIVQPGADNTIAGDIGGLQVNAQLPVNTSSEPITALLTSTDTQTMPDGYALVGDMFTMRLTSANGTAAMAADQPVMLTIAYAATSNSVDQPMAVSLQTWNAEAERWEMVPATVNETEQTLTALLSQTATMAVWLKEGATTNSLYLPNVQR